jgi:hypothetical protein
MPTIAAVSSAGFSVRSDDNRGFCLGLALNGSSDERQEHLVNYLSNILFRRIASLE